jgi:hypothetical protein
MFERQAVGHPPPHSRQGQKHRLKPSNQEKSHATLTAPPVKADPSSQGPLVGVGPASPSQRLQGGMLKAAPKGTELSSAESVETGQAEILGGDQPPASSSDDERVIPFPTAISSGLVGRTVSCSSDEP